jgi:hypothetical protein
VLPISDIETAFVAAGPVPTPEQEALLHQRVCAWVDAARAEGLRPEQVIVAVREAVRRCKDRVSDRVADKAIEWCLERYFASDRPLAH